MTTFDDRERLFEEKFARDSDFEFRVIARRNKLIAQWAAEHFKFDAEEADAYVKSVLGDATRPGADALQTRILRDMTAKELAIPESEIKDRIRTVEAIARQQLLDEA